MIRVFEATEILGISAASLCVSAKYKPFYYPPPKGKRGAYFDLEGWLRQDELNYELIAQAGLLVEYLNKIEDVTYTDIAKISNVTVTSVAAVDFGYKSALKISRAVRYHMEELFKNYHTYYGYEYKGK